MNKIIITIVLFSSLFCLSGCLELRYKSEMDVGFKLKNPFMKESPKITSSDIKTKKELIDPKRKGFKKFVRKEIELCSL